MEDNKEHSNSGSLKGPWWAQGMKLFGDITTWIALPIIGALVFGKYLDRRFATEPVLLLVSAGLAFILSAYGIMRTVRDYSEKLKNTEKAIKANK